MKYLSEFEINFKLFYLWKCCGSHRFEITLNTAILSLKLTGFFWKQILFKWNIYQNLCLFWTNQLLSSVWRQRNFLKTNIFQMKYICMYKNLCLLSTTFENFVALIDSMFKTDKELFKKNIFQVKYKTDCEANLRLPYCNFKNIETLIHFEKYQEILSKQIFFLMLQNLIK